jgi:hypothetical protein
MKRKGLWFRCRGVTVKGEQCKRQEWTELWPPDSWLCDQHRFQESQPPRLDRKTQNAEDTKRRMRAKYDAMLEARER